MVVPREGRARMPRTRQGSLRVWALAVLAGAAVLAVALAAACGEGSALPPPPAPSASPASVPPSVPPPAGVADGSEELMSLLPPAPSPSDRPPPPPPSADRRDVLVSLDDLLAASTVVVRGTPESGLVGDKTCRRDIERPPACAFQEFRVESAPWPGRSLTGLCGPGRLSCVSGL